MEPISNSVRGVIGVWVSRVGKPALRYVKGLFMIGDGQRHARQMVSFNLRAMNGLCGGMRPVCVS